MCIHVILLNIILKDEVQPGHELTGPEEKEEKE
jgi:hypothetical protein